MFTGLVTGIGTVVAVTGLGDGHDARFTIAAPEGFLDGAAQGASIACAGCCLTATGIETAQDGSRFSVDVSAETLSLTTLGLWREGSRVNLERSLRIGDELGGHIVTGHVDGLAHLLSATPEQGSLRLAFSVPRALAPFIARKGSVAIDGVSLTVNGVRGDGFGVNIIPHTAAVTTLGALAPGDPVNLEIDVLARYIARFAEAAGPTEAGPLPTNSP